MEHLTLYLAGGECVAKNRTLRTDVLELEPQYFIKCTGFIWSANVSAIDLTIS